MTARAAAICHATGRATFDAGSVIETCSVGQGRRPYDGARRDGRERAARASSCGPPVEGSAFAGSRGGAWASLDKWGETAHVVFARETFLAHHSFSGLTNSHR